MVNLGPVSASRPLVPNLSKHQGRIRPAEAEGVRERNRNRSSFGLVWHQVNRRLDRWILEVDRRRRDLIANGKDREDRLDRTRSTQKVPDRRFGRGHAQPCGLIPRSEERRVGKGWR